MLTVKPGQIWERKSVAGAPWRGVQVLNVGAGKVELRFSDRPSATDLEQVIRTMVGRMLAGSNAGGPSEYRFVRE
jgi:hypothetical protein